MDESQNPTEETENEEEKPFLKVIVHSFFIIPFLIAVFCVILFAGMHLLTRENRTVYDYLEDVKAGGVTKRWQGAFELSKILANPKLLPEDTRFYDELIGAFEQARHDDNRVRQYLALAMGRTERTEFLQPLLDGLKAEKEENLPAIIYAIGMLKQKESAKYLYDFLAHPNARIRSIATVALGNLGDRASIKQLKKVLGDSEPNVRWGAAISLANLDDDSGKEILLQLLTRSYYESYEQVDQNEVKNLILSTIDACQKLDNNDLNVAIKQLAESDPNMKIRARALEALNKKNNE